MVMQKCPIPSDLVGEYSAACQIVSQYEELRSMGPVDPDKASWAGQELYTKTLIERIALLTAALKSAWEEDEALDEDLILHALQIGLTQPSAPAADGKCGVCGGDHKDWTVHGTSLPRRGSYLKTGACQYRYPGGAQCGFQYDDCMHEGSPSRVVPPNGRHKFKCEGIL